MPSASAGTAAAGDTDAANGPFDQLTGPALKLVVEVTPPHRVVGVHAFGEDACELIHFGTTLVQVGSGGIWWDAFGCGGMRWDEVGCGGMRWDVVGCGGMRWDVVG
jgi:hypothetical protein